MIDVYQANNGIRSFFNTFDQVGIEAENFSVQTDELTHDEKWRVQDIKTECGLMVRMPKFKSISRFICLKKEPIYYHD